MKHGKFYSKMIFEFAKNLLFNLKKNNYTFTDKTLDNFFYIGLIKSIFPQAKVINCKREPISSIMSNTFSPKL